MNNNEVGIALKKLVSTVFILGIGIALFAGIGAGFKFESFAAGILVAIAFGFIAWVSAVTLNGFAEIVIKVTEIAQNTKTLQTELVSEDIIKKEKEELSTPFTTGGAMNIPKRNKQ